MKLDIDCIYGKFRLNFITNPRRYEIYEATLDKFDNPYWDKTNKITPELKNAIAIVLELLPEVK